MPDDEAYPHRDETEADRLDRNFNELLQELRVAQTGVQILFAFLLTLAFSQRFTSISELDKVVYVMTLLLCAAAAALLIAPVAFHRIVFRKHKKDVLVHAGNTLAIAGLGALLLAVTGAVLLIIDVVLGDLAAAIITAATFGFFVALWVVVPLVARTRVRSGRAQGE